MRTLIALLAASLVSAAASAAELPATPLPAPAVAQNCKPGILRTSTAEVSRLCARPLAMTIIEHQARPKLRT